MVDITVRPVQHAHDAFQASPVSGFETSKPVIPRMLALNRSLKKTGELASENYLTGLQHDRDGIKVWSKKEMDYLVEVANRTWLEQGWAAVKALADCIISFASFVMGGYFLAQGGTAAGAFFIAAGIFNIIKTVFARQGMWDWIATTLAEKNESVRDKLKLAFPIIISLLGLGFSIAGGALAVEPNSLMSLLKSAEGFIGIGGQLISSVFSIQKGFDDARAPAIRGELKKYEQSADLHSRLLEFCMNETRRMSLKKPITALMQATTFAAQKV